MPAEKAQSHGRGPEKFCFQFNGSGEAPGNNYLLSAHSGLDTILSAGIERKTCQGHALQELMLVVQWQGTEAHMSLLRWHRVLGESRGWTRDGRG